MLEGSGQRGPSDLQPGAAHNCLNGLTAVYQPAWAAYARSPVAGLRVADQLARSFARKHAARHCECVRVLNKSKVPWSHVTLGDTAQASAGWPSIPPALPCCCPMGAEPQVVDTLRGATTNEPGPIDSSDSWFAGKRGVKAVDRRRVACALYHAARWISTQQPAGALEHASAPRAHSISRALQQPGGARCGAAARGREGSCVWNRRARPRRACGGHGARSGRLLRGWLGRRWARAAPRAAACTSAASIVYVHTVILWQLGMVPRLATAADVRPGWSARGVLHRDPGMAGMVPTRCSKRRAGHANRLQQLCLREGGRRTTWLSQGSRWPSPVSGQGPWPSRRGLQRAVGHRLPGTALNHGPADAALGREEPGWHATAAQAGSSHQEQRWARDVPVGMCAASPPPGVAALELQAAVWARDGYVPHRPVLVLHGSSGDCYGRGGQQGANAASVRHRSAARLQRRRSGGLCARCAVAVC